MRKRLTAAQRRFLMYVSEESRVWIPIDISENTIRSCLNRGLVERELKGFMRSWKLTDMGREVLSSTEEERT